MIVKIHRGNILGLISIVLFGLWMFQRQIATLWAPLLMLSHMPLLQFGMLSMSVQVFMTEFPSEDQRKQKKFNERIVYSYMLLILAVTSYMHDQTSISKHLSCMTLVVASAVFSLFWIYRLYGGYHDNKSWKYFIFPSLSVITLVISHFVQQPLSDFFESFASFTCYLQFIFFAERQRWHHNKREVL